MFSSIEYEEYSKIQQHYAQYPSRNSVIVIFRLPIPDCQRTGQVYNIIRLLRMRADPEDVRNPRPLLLYFITLVLALVCYFPMQEVRKFQTAHELTNNLTLRMEMLKQDSDNDLRLEDLLVTLEESPYVGTWVNDMKQSKLLESDRGVIELQSRAKDTSDPSKGHYLLINVYDGLYRDSGHYQIQIESSYIKSDLALSGKNCIFQAKSHLIGLYRSTNMFFQTRPDSILTNNAALYIQKLKFRLSTNAQKLHLELLLGAQNDINIVTNKMQDSHRFYFGLALSIFLTLQGAFQFLAAFYLTRQLEQSDTLRKSLSPKLIEYLVAFDLAQLGLMVFLFFQVRSMKFMSLPIAMFIYLIFWAQIKILTIISPLIGEQGESLSLRKSLTHYNSCLLKGLCAFFLFYFNNMHLLLFLVFYSFSASPQIYQNFKRGAKITYQMQWLALFLVARVLPIIPNKVFGGTFHLETSYVSAAICFLLTFIQIGLLYLQKIYGSRSILPKFLTPKGFSEFKFFMIQDENHVCSQCQEELKAIPATAQASQNSILCQSKIVVTPCNHKFHLPCLVEWMESSQLCPVCKANLPPIDEEDEGSQ